MIEITKHANERLNERFGHMTAEEESSLAEKAFQEGKEWEDIPPSYARDFIYSKSFQDNKIVLYNNAVFVFGDEGGKTVLVTAYKPMPLSTSLYELDYSWLTKHVLEPRFWFVPWSVFDYAGATLSAYLVGIDFKTRQFTLGLEVRFPHKGDDDKSNGDMVTKGEIQLPLNHPEYTEYVFKRKLVSAYRDLCIKAARKDLRLTKDYALLKRDDDIKLADAQRQADALCDSAGIKDEVLRKAISERYAKKAKANSAENWAETQCRKWYAPCFIAFARWSDMDNVANQYARRDLGDEKWEKDQWNEAKNSKRFFDIRKMRIME